MILEDETPSQKQQFATGGSASLSMRLTHLDTEENRVSVTATPEDTTVKANALEVPDMPQPTLQTASSQAASSITSTPAISAYHDAPTPRGKCRNCNQEVTTDQQRVKDAGGFYFHIVKQPAC